MSTDTPRTNGAVFVVFPSPSNDFEAVDAEFARQLERELTVANNWVEHHQNHCDDLIKENAALREWVKEEGKRNDVCTYGILKEVCEDCRCGKRKEAQP